jgi:hypothetical protein
MSLRSNQSSAYTSIDVEGSFVLAVQRDRGAGPFGRRISGGLISKHITVPVSVLAGDDDAGLVGDGLKR